MQDGAAVTFLARTPAGDPEIRPIEPITALACPEDSVVRQKARQLLREKSKCKHARRWATILSFTTAGRPLEASCDQSHAELPNVLHFTTSCLKLLPLDDQARSLSAPGSLVKMQLAEMLSDLTSLQLCVSHSSSEVAILRTLKPKFRIRTPRSRWYRLDQTGPKPLGSLLMRVTRIAMPI